VLRWLLRRFSPALAAAVEAESRAWMIRCEKCGQEVSVWDSGGIRYRATRRAKPIVGKCRACGETGLLRLRFDPQAFAAATEYSDDT
jgi:uncharacterized OB-fold protein